MARFSLSKMFLLSLALFPSALAAPTRLFGRSVSQTVLDRLNLMEQYAAASYCEGNNNSTGTKVTCSVGNCPLVQAANTITVSEFENSPLTDVTGFIAVDSTNKLIVVSFRGSESVQNWLANLDFPLVSADELCSGCNVDTGFYTSWKEARSNVLSIVKSAITSNPSYEVIAVGHSLGAAVATFAAVELRQAGYNTGLFTFGSPRVGDSTFVTYISTQSGESYRVTHENDIVPKLPPLLLGYRHVAGEYWITSDDNVVVTTSDITVFTGLNYVGGNAWTLTDSTSAHTWYFNHISGCYSG